jgi:hypothetical protein
MCIALRLGERFPLAGLGLALEHQPRHGHAPQFGHAKSAYVHVASSLRRNEKHSRGVCNNFKK